MLLVLLVLASAQVCKALQSHDGIRRGGRKVGGGKAGRGSMLLELLLFQLMVCVEVLLLLLLLLLIRNMRGVCATVEDEGDDGGG